MESILCKNALVGVGIEYAAQLCQCPELKNPMFGQDGVNVVPIGVMTFFSVVIFHVSTANIIGKEMLFKIGERSENGVFVKEYNRSVNWVWSAESTMGVLNMPFSGCFEWNDWFCLYSSYEHWNSRI